MLSQHKATGRPSNIFLYDQVFIYYYVIIRLIDSMSSEPGTNRTFLKIKKRKKKNQKKYPRLEENNNKKNFKKITKSKKNDKKKLYFLKKKTPLMSTLHLKY